MRFFGAVLSISSLLLYSANAAPALIPSLPTDGLISTPDLSGADSLANTDALTGTTGGLNIVKKGLLPTLPTDGLVATPDLTAVDGLTNTNGLANTDSLTGATDGLNIVKKGLLPSLPTDGLIATPDLNDLANTDSLTGATDGLKIVKKGLLPSLPTDGLIATPDLDGLASTDSLTGATDGLKIVKRGLLPSGILPTSTDGLASTDELTNTDALTGATPDLTKGIDSLGNTVTLGGITKGFNVVKKGLLPSGILPTDGLTSTSDLTKTDALTGATPDLTKGIDSLGNDVTLGGITKGFNVVKKGLLPALDDLVAAPGTLAPVDGLDNGAIPAVTQLSNSFKRGILPAGLVPTQGDGLVPTPDLHSVVDTDALGDTPNLNILTRELLKSELLPTDGLLATPEGLSSIESLANTDSLTGATGDEDVVEKRALVEALTTSVTGVVGSLSKQISTATSTSGLLSLLVSAAPGAAPENTTVLASTLKSIWGTTPTNWFSALADQILAGIVPAIDLISLSTIVDPVTGPNSVINANPREPAQPVFPQKSIRDAPYSLTEEELRQIIQFPEGFTYGEKQPVIFVPGTGVYGYEAFQNNLIKLLTGVDYADPVWINVPKAMIGDAQVNSEYVAYAINYIAGITNRNVSVVTWSQGGLDAQWALTFWPSTREVVSNLFPISADFHGTVLADLICLNFNGVAGIGPCDPSVLQQEYTSNYVKALLAKDQLSAWVPTTSFYSGLLDEVVQPQEGASASAYRLDIRNVGVTNVEPQLVCPGRLAGTFYGHAGMMYNPLTFALIQDGLVNGGPGQLERIDLAVVCLPYVAPGLTLTDAILTAATIVLSGLRILAYLPKLVTEPALMAYVINDVA